MDPGLPASFHRVLCKQILSVRVEGNRALHSHAQTQQRCDADACLQCQVTKVDFAPQHALSYNELIGLVKFNILTSDWGDEDHTESILSEKRSQWSSQMFKNIRCAKSLCMCVPEGKTQRLSVHWRAHGDEV